MKKLLALALVLMMVMALVPASAAGEKITISILTSRHTAGTNDIEEVWFFKYLEKKMSEMYGYDLHFELEQTLEPNDYIPRMLNSGDLPDLVWGINLSASNAVKYGAGEGMLLDWSTLLTPEQMPNAYAKLNGTDALLASTCVDGKVYSLPTLLDRDYWDYTGGMSESFRLYVRQSWLDACNLQMPTTLDDFMNMLYAFKDVKTPTGDPAIPVVENADFFKYFIWAALGFTGNSSCGAYGTTFAIKNGEVVLPCYTEEYREFVRLFNQMYNDGLISPDFFTMDGTTAAAKQEGGECGVMGNWSLGGMATSFPDWVAVSPITSDWCEKMIWSNHYNYTVGPNWASADCEHPEVLAQIMDYMYTAEGASLYVYGPMKGEEEEAIGLGMCDGWYIKEDGNITNDTTESGAFTDYQYYTNNYIQTINNPAIDRQFVTKNTWAKAGIELPFTAHELTDALTGEKFMSYELKTWTDDTPAGHWRLTSIAAWQNNVTCVMLPALYMSEDDALRASDLKSAIETYVKGETAKFIAGERSLDTLDAYFEDLKGMNVEEYIALYQEGYKPYMESVFGK